MVNSHSNRPHLRIYTDEGDGEIITYLPLKNVAICVTDGLQQRGLQPVGEIEREN
ncbi:MAG: hypothetical protein GQ549_01325 [Gammaproteobacteria bacterium]|nr:hypothetical protein [Gammaproteobacteria bacterium]